MLEGHLGLWIIIFEHHCSLILIGPKWQIIYRKLLAPRLTYKILDSLDVTLPFFSSGSSIFLQWHDGQNSPVVMGT